MTRRCAVLSLSVLVLLAGGCGGGTAGRSPDAGPAVDGAPDTAPPDRGPDSALPDVGVGGDAASSAAPPDWFRKTGGGYIYYLQESQKTFAEITLDIRDRLAPAGYGFVLLYVPYDGDVDAYAGLGPRDFYSGGAAGSIDEARQLVAEAHARGLAVWMWANLGYSAWTAPYYLKALADRNAGVQSHEARSFAWVGSTAQVVTYWDYPAFDWGSADWQAEAHAIVAFWLDIGMDGFVLDAWGQGINQAAGNIAAIEQQIYAKGNTIIIREYPDFEFDWEPPIVEALQGLGDATALQPTAYATAERLLEPAINETSDPTRYVLSPPALFVELGIDMLNVLTPIDDLNGYNLLSAAERAELDAMVGVINRNRALNLDATKVRAPTDDQAACYVEMRTAASGGQVALAAFNFSAGPRTCNVNLSGAGGPTSGTTADLASGAAGPVIIGGRVAVELAGYGRRFLGVGP